MEDSMRRSYQLFWVIFALSLLFMFFVMNLAVQSRDIKQGYEIITDYNISEYGDVTAPLQTRTAYSFVLDGVEGPYCHLIAYTEHQEIRVFVDNNCVYRMKVQTNNLFGKSPGNVWINVPFLEEDNGKTVTIELSPVYQAAVNDATPVFYFGTEGDIMHSALLRGLPNFVLSLFAVAIGIAFLLFVRCNFRNSHVERNLRMMGYFIIHMGLLKLADSKIMPMLFPDAPAIAVAFPVVLMFVWIPVPLILKNIYSTCDHWVWYLPCGIGFSTMFLTLLLQYMDVADMYEMLPIIRINIVVIILLVMGMTVYEVRTVGWSKKLVEAVCALGICFVGQIAEGACEILFREHFIPGLSIVCMTLYACFVAVKLLREVKRFMEVGIRAKQYEKMAFHDQLTGLFNRTAFAEHTDALEFLPEQCIVIVMDLNNLKSCNDKLGHAKGDIYIKESARIIQECFGDIGRCYRMGGDEFYVLVENGSPSLCRERLKTMKELVENCDKIGEGFHMGIACGFKMYDRHLDYDINETARRADKVMYQEKFAMKEL